MLRIREHVDLAPYTTLGVGGTARYVVDAATIDEAREALTFARDRKLPLSVLGGGSNVVVADAGVPGVVLRLTMRGTETHESSNDVVVTAQAGDEWDALVAHSVSRGYAGIECLSGIPGWVGAAPIQNIGAYGQEVADTLAGVTVLERATGAVHEVAPSACGFAYRDSVFKRDPDRWLVLAISLRLRKDGAPTLKYPELVRTLASLGREPTLHDVRVAVLHVRRGKSMVLDAADPDSRSAGSFFVNPTVVRDQLIDVLQRVNEHLGTEAGTRMPQFPQTDGRVKLSAAWLIESAGFSKGTVRGRVGLSTKHTLALINRGGASAHDLLHFAREIQDKVAEHFGVTLAMEPRLLGQFEPPEPVTT